MAALYGMMQARLQARHGARMDLAQWRRLTATTRFDHFLARVRETSLGPWLEGLDPAGDVHHLEEILRGAWRRHVLEIVAWAPKVWHPAILWVITLQDLAPALHRREKGGISAWINQIEGLETLELPPVGQDPLAWWLERWQTLWPRHPVARTQLIELIRLLQTSLDHFTRLEGSEAAHTAWHSLKESLELRFRRYAMGPPALFVHVLLTAMDLHQLRGELVRRRLFPAAGQP
ncbi:MAG: hypothetical protein H7839_08665 [Magnetococcus sp. YQC-5]